MAESLQNVPGSITYIDDWTARLARAYPSSSVTITSATGITSSGTLTGVSGSGTSITFHLSTPTAPIPPVDVIVTLSATLSNGDVDVRKVAIGVS